MLGRFKCVFSKDQFFFSPCFLLFLFAKNSSFFFSLKAFLPCMYFLVAQHSMLFSHTFLFHGCGFSHHLHILTSMMIIAHVFISYGDFAFWFGDDVFQISFGCQLWIVVS